MNYLEITGLEQIVLGVYLIAHGCIHLMFLFYFKDEKTNVYTGWSGNSWLLKNFLGQKIIKYIGFTTWIIIAILFTLSGLGILDVLPINEYLGFLLIFVSLIAIIGYVIFFDGFSPSPYHWILGVVIDLIIIVFVTFFSTELLVMIVLLLLVWIYGMFLHTQVLKGFGKNSSIT